MMYLGDCCCDGGFNGPAISILVQRTSVNGALREFDFGAPYHFHVVGSFTTYRGKLARSIARFEKGPNGRTTLDQGFCLATQFENPLNFVTWDKGGPGLPVSNLFVGYAYPTTFFAAGGGGFPAHAWKLNSITGGLDPAFTPIAPDPVNLFASNFVANMATTPGLNYPFGSGYDNPRLLLNSFKRAASFDSATGALIAKPTLYDPPLTDTNIHSTIPHDSGFYLTSRFLEPHWPDSNGVLHTSPHSIRDISPDGWYQDSFRYIQPNGQPAGYNSFGYGGKFDANRGLLAKDANNETVLICGNGLEYYGVVDFSWTSLQPAPASQKHHGLFKLSVSTGLQWISENSYPDFSVNIYCQGNLGMSQPVQIDPQLRTWFVGAGITNINGTQMRGAQLYRVDVHGQNAVVFDQFDGPVYDCKWFNYGDDGKSQFIVVGGFTTYKGRRVAGMCFIDEDGNLLPELNWP